MKLPEIKTIAVLGAGTMGVGIAQSFAQAGFDINLFDINTDAINRAEELMISNLKTLERHGLTQVEEREDIISRVKGCRELSDAVSKADLVVECVFEKKEIKQDIFSKIDRLCPSQTIFASNTSYLNIFPLVPPERQEKTVITHWFAPPHIIPLVEVVKGELTGADTVQCVKELLEQIGKTPIVMNRFVPGFAINRILRILGREIFFLLDNDYITAADLDKAVKASIAPRMTVLGLVQRYDFTGLDLSAGNLKNPDYLEPPIDNSPKSLTQLVAEGNLGVKSGKGFYDYSDKDVLDTLADRDDALIQIFLAAQKTGSVGTPRD